MTFFKTSALLTGLLLTTCAAQAAQYKYILVHGFQPSQLQDKPNPAQVVADGEDYWRGFWLAHAHARLDWPSHERIQTKIATDYLWPKLQQLSRDNLCQTGCILVTHSTGDLVTRYLLDNQATWLRNAGLQPLNIVATFDFAGAGGGSELADVAINVADGKAGSVARAAVKAWLGYEPTRANVGVLNDLQVNVARQLTPTPQNRIPRIRFVAGGSDYLNATSPLLPGSDDGVVAAHSACGSATAGSFGSCSKTVALSGKLGNQSDAVSAFWPNHLPFFMAANYSHAELVENRAEGAFTTAVNKVSYGAGSVTVQTYDEKARWPFSGTYRYVQDSKNQSVSGYIQRVAF